MESVEQLEKDNRKALAYKSGMMGPMNPGGREEQQELAGSEKSVCKHGVLSIL
jgi:hypothetical protein